MNIDKFKELLSVPSKTYQEEDMVEYICNELDSIEGVMYYRDEMMNVYATKGVLEEGEYYPMFIAHTDTVHTKIDKIVVKEEKLKRPNTFGKTFDDTLVDVLKAYDEEGNPTGIGGDDKCGIFICLELLKQLDKVKIGLFVSEETGCHGSSKCDESFLTDVGYITQYDAPGNHLISEICSGVRLFERDSEFFEKSISVIEAAFGNEMLVQSHPYTDVSQLKKKIDVSCINMSCGYYNMHTKEEFISIDDVEHAIEAGKNMVKELGLNKHQYEYKPIVYTNKTIMNSFAEEFDDDLDIFEVQEIESHHRLQTIDVYEEKDGITLTDVYDDGFMFIPDEDLENLYEIIKERLIKKY
jgi:putative aminopeptidase FrvX